VEQINSGNIIKIDRKQNDALAGICRAAPDGVHILVDPPQQDAFIVKTAIQQQWDIVYKATDP
jgi:hypothetical protein